MNHTAEVLTRLQKQYMKNQPDPYELILIIEKMAGSLAILEKRLEALEKRANTSN